MHFRVVARILMATIGCFALANAANNVYAQSASMFGANSPTGGSNGMGTASTGATFGSSAFPTSTFPAGGATTGTGLGAQGFGAQAGMGATGFGATGQTGQTGGLLGLSAGTNLIGTGAPAGVSPTGQPGQMTNRQGMQNRNANRRTGQNRNQMNQAGGAAANQQKSTVRPQLLVAFEYNRPSADATQTAIATRFSKLASNAKFKGVEVETDGDVVVLRGQVESERTGKLAVVLARMEPGVKSVRNELTVAEPASPTPAPGE